MAVDIPTFASTQISLLAAELQAEVDETSMLVSLHSPSALQRAGVALTNLAVLSQRTGLGGKTVVELGPDGAFSSSGDLPEHGIRSGDIVLLAEQPAASGKKREVKELERKGVKGVVTRVGRQALGVAVGEDGEGEVVGGDRRVWIVKLADEVTWKRMNGTMEKMAKMAEGEYSYFMRVLFGLTTPSPVPEDLSKDEEVGEGKVKWFDTSLNESQKDAIRFALKSQEIALIHGPPGVSFLFFVVFFPFFLFVYQLTPQKDRENPHPNRTNPPTPRPQPQLPHPRLRPLQYLGRQHR